jgi:hypothetical protein
MSVLAGFLGGFVGALVMERLVRRYLRWRHAALREAIWSTYEQVWDEHVRWRQRAEAAEAKLTELQAYAREQASVRYRIEQLEAGLREVRACASPEHDLCDDCCAKVDALLADKEQP